MADGEAVLNFRLTISTTLSKFFLSVRTSILMWAVDFLAAGVAFLEGSFFKEALKAFGFNFSFRNLFV
jgi:hypothetical protein